MLLSSGQRNWRAQLRSLEQVDQEALEGHVH
jgi:hypothetical protein